MEYAENEFLGRYVLSSNFGVGTVLSIEEMGGDGKQFLVIESLNNSVKNFIPVEKLTTIVLPSLKMSFKA